MEDFNPEAKETKQPSSLEDKLIQFGYEVSITPRTEGEDEYGGYINITGDTEQVRKLLIAVAEFNGAYNPGYAVNEIKKDIGTWSGPTFDISIKDADGKMKMIRVIAGAIGDRWNVQFGGGGNLTKFEEMETALEKAVAQLLS